MGLGRTSALGAAVACALLGAAPALPQTAAGPSFDCAKAQSPDERAICADPRLAEMDRAVSAAYAAVPAGGKAEARRSGAGFLQSRRRCGAEEACILGQQALALHGYDDLGATVPVPPWVGGALLDLAASGGGRPAAGLPTALGQCARTRITGISDRFGGVPKPPTADDPGAGTRVGFANGGNQVSYSYEAPVARSAVGDAVLLCLVSIPQNCPKGDDRGRFYAGVNVRTKGFWVLPDSQHLCGGA